MLILAVFALLLPAVFDYTGRSIRHTADVAFSDEALSLSISCVWLLLARRDPERWKTAVDERSSSSKSDKIRNKAEVR
jgi:hypothetical protein